MTVKSSGSIALNGDLGWEFGRTAGQSTSMSTVMSSNESIGPDGVTPRGNFGGWYNTSSARALTSHTSEKTVMQVYSASVNRRWAWEINLYHNFYRARGTFGDSATMDTAGFQGTGWPGGVEPFHEAASVYYNQPSSGTISFNSSGSSGPGPINTLKSYSPNSDGTYPAYTAVIEGDDSGIPAQGAYTLRGNVIGYPYTTKGFGGFFSPRIWTNRTTSIVNDTDGQIYFIPFLKDPQVTIQSGTVAPLNWPNSAQGGPQALEVTSYDTNGFNVRNRFASQAGINNSSFDFDYSPGHPVAGSMINVNAVLRYQNQDFSVNFQQFIHFIRLNQPGGGGY